MNNLRSVLRRRFHQISNLPDNSPSPDLVLALTNAIRKDPICINQIVCQESDFKPKFKRFILVIILNLFSLFILLNT